MGTPSFDPLADLYDLFQNWDRRLPREVGWLEPVLRHHGVETVLDAACGTGTHLLALRDEGFQVAGSDLSPRMIERARDRLGSEADLAAVPFTGVPDRFEPRDAVLVLGNSLPNAGTEEEVRRSVHALAAAVRPGGVLVLHLMNFPLLVVEGGRLAPVRQVIANDREHLFLKVFEVHPEKIVLDVITLTREDEAWSRDWTRSILWPVPPDWLRQEVAAAGLETVRITEGFSNTPFDPTRSGDLVLLARARKALT